MNTEIPRQDSWALPLIGVLSVAIPVVVAILLFAPPNFSLGSFDPHFLPHLNAVLNSATFLALMAGFISIKNGRKDFHRMFMGTAIALSSLFLVSYVVFHATVPPTPFGGEGTVKAIYYVLLISHIVLAAAVVPLVLLAVYHAYTANWAKHVKIVKWTFPIWAYVALTGVLVYLMISPYYTF